MHSHDFIRCSNCSIKDFCLPMMLSEPDVDRLDEIIQRNKSFAKGETIYSIGAHFSHIYVIRSGYIKSYALAESGEQQITGFHLPGEIVGLEGINTGTHIGFSEALVPSQLCAIPYDKLDSLNANIDGLRQQLFRVMSQEISHNYELLLLLNQKNADEKIATFLLNLAAREARGNGLDLNFTLPMTRTDIANYLGLALETVSRIFSRIVSEGVISVEHRNVSINSVPQLSEIAGTSCHA